MRQHDPGQSCCLHTRDGLKLDLKEWAGRAGFAQVDGMLIFAVNIHSQASVEAIVAQIPRDDRQGRLAVEGRDADVVVVLQVASVEEPADGGVRDGLGPAREVDRMVVPGPGFPHRRIGKSGQELDRNVAVLGVIAAFGVRIKI